MRVLLETPPAFADPNAGPGHPERPERLDAVLEGIDTLDLGDDLVRVEPRPATPDELITVHEAGFVEADAAFCAVRPPGHHAAPAKAMGFCLLNSVAVCAAALADRGEKVVIVDWDAHHGNGTQDIFFADPRVPYVSMHQWPLFPGCGRLEKVGTGEGEGSTINLPFPPDATGDVYLAAFDRVVDAAASHLGPTWVLVSAGFDAHRDCPITSLGLSTGDYADLMRRSAALAPQGRCVAFLEVGYDLDALRGAAEACVGALVGIDRRPEPPTSGGPGMDVAEAAADLRSS